MRISNFEAWTYSPKKINSPRRKFSNLARSIFVLFLSIIYGGLLSQIPNEDFKDFANYLIYAEHSWLRFIGMTQLGILPTLTNEPVWLLLNSVLGLYLEPEVVVRVIIFISASSVAWLVLTRYPTQFIWLFLFLLMPMVIKNFLIHLRQGVAIALFLWGWYSSGSFRRWLLMGLAPFVHASFFFVLALLFFAKILQRFRLGSDLRTLGFVVLGVLIGSGLGWIASVLGARQALEYDFSMTDVSGIGFVVWGLVAIIWMFEGRRFLRSYAFEAGVIVFYLSTYWLIEVTARIFESGLILVLIAGLALTKWRRFAFLSVVLGFGGLSWALRFGQEGMGFIA